MAISNPIELAAEIVTAFVSHNSVPRSELSALFETVHAAVRSLGDGTESALAAIETKAPAVSVRKSVTPDYLTCLDDGKQFKVFAASFECAWHDAGAVSRKMESCQQTIRWWRRITPRCGRRWRKRSGLVKFGKRPSPARATRLRAPASARAGGPAKRQRNRALPNREIDLTWKISVRHRHFITSCAAQRRRPLSLRYY